MTRNLPDDFPTVATAEARPVDGEHSLYAPQTVDEWPCRKCGAMTPVCQGGLDTFQQFSKLLGRMGQEPLKPEECLLCDDCTVKYRAARDAKNADNDAKIRRYCIQLRDASTPAHLLGEAERFVSKVANDGPDLVRHYAELRRKNVKSRGGI